MGRQKVKNLPSPDSNKYNIFEKEYYDFVFQFKLMNISLYIIQNEEFYNDKHLYVKYKKLKILFGFYLISVFIYKFIFIIKVFFLFYQKFLKSQNYIFISQLLEE